MVIPNLELDPRSEAPVYRQIAEWIRAAARDGRLPAGERLPATRDLARQLGVNRNTVVSAYEFMASRGWVTGHTGKGTFVASHPEAVGSGTPSSDDAGTWFTAFSRQAESAESGLKSIYRLSIATGGISFVGSYPAGEMLPVTGFSRSMAEVLASRGAEVLAYGPTAGHPPLRAAIAETMRGAGSRVGPDDILITNGAQQAIELVFSALVDRGQAVVIEEPTYTGALSVLSQLGARPVAVPVDDEGIRPDLLEIALERHRPRLIYVQPTFQNPTARVMGEGRRRQILALAARHHCPLIEDDWGGGLRLEGDELPTLHALDGGQHVVYLSTFSKKLMPGLRVGWVTAPPAVIERLVELKRVRDCGTSPLIQAALHGFLRNGGLEEHLERVLPAYRDRRDAMLSALSRHFPAEAHWTRPAGGLFLWVTLPRGFDGNELFVAAGQEGVFFSQGDLFHSDGSGRNTLRLTYSSATPERIEAGVEILGRLVKERLERAAPVGRSSTESMPIL
jgi:2-aminoadipate transaminase